MGRFPRPTLGWLPEVLHVEEVIMDEIDESCFSKCGPQTIVITVEGVLLG